MIKVENIQVYGWEAASRGARNPLNSWDRSDSDYCFNKNHQNCEKCWHRFKSCDYGATNNYCLGPNDFDLTKRLCKAGNSDRKFLRMIHVQMDLTMPTYLAAEFDTYKVATVRNSCSFMHKGTSKKYSIEDFSIDEKIKYLLTPIETKKYPLFYPYETEDYHMYEINNRKYKVFKNGRIFSCAFDIEDTNINRTRHFPEKEIIPSVNKNGYYELHIGGRNGCTILLHRLISLVWIDNPNGYETVNHINNNKGQNNIENLEWVSREDNIKKGHEDGIYEKNKLKRGYLAWKQNSIVDVVTRKQIQQLYKTIPTNVLANNFGLTQSQIYNISNYKPCENNELYEQAYYWEKVIDQLNNLRNEYLETKDPATFEAIRQILPSGYNVKFTYDCSLETILNMITQRIHHRLPEWRTFCQICFDNIPYCKEFYNAMTGANINE